MRCMMEAWSQDWHLSQIYTGFAMLAAAGRISLRQRCLLWRGPDMAKPPHLRSARAMHARLIIDGGRRIYYDTHDGPEVDEAAAGSVDFYFKRSFAPGAIPDGLRGKVLPLGLNYAVYADRLDPFEVHRALAFAASTKDRLRLVIRLVARGFSPQALTRGYRPTVKGMQAVPQPRAPGRVLFMARAWDPDEPPGRPTWQRDERAEINEMRARCVILLRREFGATFTGGFKHTEYARRQYPQLLLEDPTRSSKGNYLVLLAAHPVCVATTGLHGSIGWKLAEYVAFSKAIVSEKLNYEVPGNLASGQHYLEYRTADECVERAAELMQDAERRQKMMEANRAYYEEFLRPDRLVGRTLDVARATPASVAGLH